MRPVRFLDEGEWGFGWIEDAFLRRTSHAVAVDGRVWVIDPIEGDGVDARIRALGDPAGVVQLLDRHTRDSPAFAERLGVPHHEVPDVSPAGAPFEVFSVVRRKRWREIALWFPERRVLVTADCLVTVRAYRAPAERIAVHPLLRLTPPRQLARYDTAHFLNGHGDGVHDGAAAAVRDALAGSRRRIPAWIASALRSAVRR